MGLEIENSLSFRKKTNNVRTENSYLLTYQRVETARTYVMDTL